MSLELMAFEINEAYAHYGLHGYMTPLKIIISDVLSAVLVVYLLWSGIYFKIIEKYFPPEVTNMFMVILLIAMLVARDAYVLILILFSVGGCFYIIFNNKKYEKHKNLIIYYLDKIL